MLWQWARVWVKAAGLLSVRSSYSWAPKAQAIDRSNQESLDGDLCL